jgi:hypothetical protein
MRKLLRLTYRLFILPVLWLGADLIAAAIVLALGHDDLADERRKIPKRK